jgi:hypothetical protein
MVNLETVFLSFDLMFIKNRKSFVDQYFGITMESEMKCIENEEEEPTKSTEEFFQLSCFISPEVKYLQSGLQEVIFFPVYVLLSFH